MKGIILAGGTGSRLAPITKSISKQLLPVYDKPMIYYPLSVLMLAKIRQILIITTPDDLPLFQKLLGDGKWLGMEFQYAVQEKPAGIAQAFLIGKDFIKDENVALILGDNIFWGQSFTSFLTDAAQHVSKNGGAAIFGYSVKDPSSYGVINFKDDKPIDITEKPVNPSSSFAVPGLYFYDSQVTQIAQTIRPSPRGELEITDINNHYLKNQKCHVQLLGRGMTWLDTGTSDSLLEASNFIATIQKRQGLYVSCVEEIAFRNGWITRQQVLELSQNYSTDYGQYLKYIADTIPEIQRH